MLWKEKIRSRVKTRLHTKLDVDNELIDDLIVEAYVSIMKYSNASIYQYEWDSTLVRCVLALYNRNGAEEIISRTANGVSDNYGSVDALQGIIAGDIPQYITPLGTRLLETRFSIPTIEVD